MRIFTVEDDKLKLSPDCFTIPELKAVVDEYEDPIPAFIFIDAMTWPEGPYSNLSDAEREEYASQDAGGDFSLDDEVIETAIEKCKVLYGTPMDEYYQGQKNSMIVVGKFLRGLTEASITTGRDGNLSEIMRMQKEAGKTFESFMKVEKLWKEQVQQKLRGGSQLGEY
jgi:hypothetical protein